MTKSISNLLTFGVMSCALVFLTIAASAQSADGPGFRSEYQRQYDALKSLAPDIVVFELRDRVELIASRGSQVGAVSNERRVSGFETALLSGLQDLVCRGRDIGPARPSPAIAERVKAAAATQRLVTEAGDMAKLTAQAQLLLDSQPRQRWCALTSLGDIR